MKAGEFEHFYIYCQEQIDDIYKMIDLYPSEEDVLKLQIAGWERAQLRVLQRAVASSQG
jgi:hypothetical protein